MYCEIQIIDKLFFSNTFAKCLKKLGFNLIYFNFILKRIFRRVSLFAKASKIFQKSKLRILKFEARDPAGSPNDPIEQLADNQEDPSACQLPASVAPEVNKVSKLLGN